VSDREHREPKESTDTTGYKAEPKQYGGLTPCDKHCAQPTAPLSTERWLPCRRTMTLGCATALTPDGAGQREVRERQATPPRWRSKRARDSNARLVGCQVAEDEAVAVDDLAAGASNRGAEDRPRVDEGVELAVLAAGVDGGRKIGQ